MEKYGMPDTVNEEIFIARPVLTSLLAMTTGIAHRRWPKPSISRTRTACP